jgi:FkbM family methyltransferase
MKIKSVYKIKTYYIFSLIFILIFLNINNFKNEESKENNNILSPYIKQQKNYCKKYFNKFIEDQIYKTKVKIQNYSYEIFLYKKDNFIKAALEKNGEFEEKEIINVLKVLQYYGKRKNIINNKDIFMLDIGGNIGWYPSFLGRFGYSIISFEPFETNYYILFKNYCMNNKESNVVIVTKGLDIEEKKCHYYVQVGNLGNGMTICNNNKTNIQFPPQQFKRVKDVSMTKLSNFIPFLLSKHLALIKIDIEGAEEKAIEGGIDLISKYHVPFILIEFTPLFLKNHGTDPNKFIQLFVKNGYYISLNNFIDNNFISDKRLMEVIGFQKNIYLIHKTVINN